ncbi:FAD-dependent oxidoreductase [Proteiniphilum sp. X52]|uniref:FAD-dependent oxidoreductase n=1 Tax=Proteiniphilum sp. X52 TaxID=2382159 RepID=UPI000F0A76F7|nr:FAD-dependent oxidoreductase [Proteiniphilum sp. X52]RNC64103.1 FAD-dependent oxidoreductase [Proteiniphilum sp. X52]
MKKYGLVLLFAMVANGIIAQSPSLLVEAENFSKKGGWVVDQQFMDLMGSPYLMAHGMGVPVADAEISVEFPSTGEYDVYVRTFNWTSPWYEGEGPGKFQIRLNGEKIGSVLGSRGNEWYWQKAGKVEVRKKDNVITLQDLTGFNGRVDAIYFTQDNISPPNEPATLGHFRKQMLDIPEEPQQAGEFDLVVVGGGVAGTTAAISAARSGLKVALIQDRPVLGGNNSSEVRVHLGGRIKVEPYPALGDVVKEIGPARGGNAQPADYYEDGKKMQMVLAEENISLFTNYRAFAVKTEGSSITEVQARHIETSEELSFAAPLFADCTGDGTIGFLAGADYAMGRESKDEFGEPTAPETPDKMTMGASVQWYSAEESQPVDFPVFQYGVEFNDESVKQVAMGEWTWETGMNYDQINEFERIRDYGLMVVYSNWSWLKNFSADKEKYANRRLDWVAYIAGKRESRRLLGDHILKEQDLTDFVIYPDASAPTTWTIDLHYPDPQNTEHFPENEFLSIAIHKPIHPYPIPYRCLYSRNIDNLFMAGRNISVTHVALGTVRVMRTTGIMGEVVGMAASIAARNNTNPRGVYNNYLGELKKLMKKGVGKYEVEDMQNYNLGGSLGPKIHSIEIPLYDKD